MAIRQICHYKYTNRIYINQILVRWSSTLWHIKNRAVIDCSIFFVRIFRNYIYNPPKPSFDKEGFRPIQYSV